MATITNRDLQTCTVQVGFTRGGEMEVPPVRVNGEATAVVELTIPRGGARMVTLTAEQLVQGNLVIVVLPPCTTNSVSVSGSYQIQGPAGQVREVFTLRPNGADTWLRNGRCLVVTTNQNPGGTGGPVENLGVATSPVVPGFRLPAGSTLNAFFFDEDGQRVADQSLPIDGVHTASFPIPANLEGKVTIVFCLNTMDGVDVDLTPVKLVQREGFQFDNSPFVDGFESGDTSSWSDQIQ